MLLSLMTVVFLRIMLLATLRIIRQYYAMLAKKTCLPNKV